MEHKTILGIDPGTKEMGLVVIAGPRLLHFGVQRLRNGTRPYDVIGQARRAVLQAVNDHSPQVIVIEEPFNLATKRAHLLNVIDEELRSRAQEIGLHVVSISPMQARQLAVGSGRATKIDTAERLARERFPALAPLIPKRPHRAALGLSPKDKYWLHMFDALALAVAIQPQVDGRDSLLSTVS